jgi:hypothetical protein
MPASEKPMGYMCCCINIRFAVLAYAFCLLWDSFLCVLGHFTDDVRLFVGGYTMWTRHVTSAQGVLGLMYSTIGILGCYDGEPIAIRRFGYFCVVRLIAIVAIFSGDMYCLTDCEHYGRMLSNHEDYNPTMSAVADTGSCFTVRHFYWSWFAIDFLVNLYFAWGALRLAEILETWPSYHIKFDVLPKAEDALAALDSAKKDLGLEDEDFPLPIGYRAQDEIPKPSFAPPPPPTAFNAPGTTYIGPPPPMAGSISSYPPPVTYQGPPPVTYYGSM